MSFLTWHFVLAYVLDLVLGDPPGWPHPVRWIGNWINILERALYNNNQSSNSQRLAGCIFALAVLGTVFWATLLIFWVAALISSAFGHFLMIWVAYTTLATRSLHRESHKVIEALQNKDLSLARRQLSWIVSRDTKDLDEEAILRAVIETISENISDGIVAPLFYLALGGPLWAILYKATNTMDSMVGYLNDRYRYFGCFAARLDDAANFIPARLSGLFLMGAAACLKLNWHRAWQIMLRDASKMKSPNAGFPEAAVAGALGVQLGGVNVYFGKPVEKPTLGDSQEPLTVQCYHSMIRLMYATSLLAFTVFLGMRSFMIHL